MADARLPLPPFHHAEHVAFVTALQAAPDSMDVAAAEHLKLSAVYWARCALGIAGAGGALDACDVVALVRSCACARTGGYGGAPGHDAHLLYTLSALQLLALVGAEAEADVPRVRAFVRGLQRADGAFAGDAWGEADSRFTYCAFQAAALLGGGLAATLDVPRALSFLDACRNFDGGYGAVPGAESHAGQVFCAVGALAIARELRRADADTLGWWLAERQCDSGGLNGRPEKQADVCYSWWILSALALLGRRRWVDGPALARFILAAQAPGGGIADRAGNCADVFHTFFGIAGLSLLGALDGLAGHDAVDAAYALPASVVARLGLPREALEEVPAYDGEGGEAAREGGAAREAAR
jgi:geranylgeranyl transferase type-2 subunit beta